MAFYPANLYYNSMEKDRGNAGILQPDRAPLPQLSPFSSHHTGTAEPDTTADHSRSTFTMAFTTRLRDHSWQPKTKQACIRASSGFTPRVWSAVSPLSADTYPLGPFWYRYRMKNFCPSFVSNCDIWNGQCFSINSFGHRTQRNRFLWPGSPYISESFDGAADCSLQPGIHKALLTPRNSFSRSPPPFSESSSNQVFGGKSAAPFLTLSYNWATAWGFNLSYHIGTHSSQSSKTDIGIETLDCNQSIYRSFRHGII